jgi:hypothetical protein
MAMANTRNSEEEIHATPGRGTDNLHFSWSEGEKAAAVVAKGDTVLAATSMD